jgi:hypothetical protein
MIDEQAACHSNGIPIRYHGISAGMAGYKESREKIGKLLGCTTSKLTKPCFMFSH